MGSLTIAPIGSELLDDPAADPVLAAESLRNIARANRWFGGAAAVRFGLRRALAGMTRGATVSLLDIGTGAGDLPSAARRWAARRGLRLHAGGNRAESRGGEAGPADRCSLCGRVRGHATRRGQDGGPRPGESGPPSSRCDVCRGTPPGLRSPGAPCRHHHRPPAWNAGRLAFWVGARGLRFDPVTVADGMTSIRRGYTTSELQMLLAEAGVRATVTRRPGYRLVAVWRPT